MYFKLKKLYWHKKERDKRKERDRKKERDKRKERETIERDIDCQIADKIMEREIQEERNKQW